MSGKAECGPNGGKAMDIRAELAAAGESELERRGLYAALPMADLYVRMPLGEQWPLTRPNGDGRALAAFLSAAQAEQFWQTAAPGPAVIVEKVPFSRLAEAARPVGGLLVDPPGAALLLDRAELTQLAAGQIPGDLTAWLQGVDRVARQPSEILARVRRAYLHVLTGQGVGAAPRVYLLEKSEDGTQAVACFSSAATLAQFAAVRRLLQGEQPYSAALVEGEFCLRAAAGLGAYLLVDPESPWETQLEPQLVPRV